MKINLTISLDEGIVYKLKQENNYSNVVNEQLRRHYEEKNSQSLENLSKKQAKFDKEYKILKRNRAEVNKKIKILKEKENKILKFAKQYPDYVFKIIKGCDNYLNFYGIYKTDDKLRKYPWMELKKLFKEVKNE